MKIFLCAALTTLAVLVTDGKKIKIQIDSEDLVNIFEGVMYSEVLQKFASEIAKRRERKQPLKNPYHPEDELLDHLNTDIDKEIDYVSPSNPKFDFLSDQNENFLNGNNAESGDIITDNEKPNDKQIVNRNSNSTINAIDENTVMKKKIFDAVNNVIIPLKKVENISMRLKKDENINLPHKDYNNTSTPPKKEDIEILKNDRAYFKPVQRRFVLKSSNDDISTFDEKIGIKKSKYNAVNNARLKRTKTDENNSMAPEKADNIKLPEKDDYISIPPKKEDRWEFNEERAYFMPFQRRLVP